MPQHLKIKKNGRPKSSGTVESILKRKQFESKPKQLFVVRSFVDRVFANIQSLKVLT